MERAQTGNAVPPAQLDVRWFKVHQPMVSLDLFTWLAPAGPFTAEEQRERDYAFGHLLQQLRRGLKRQETVALSTQLLEYLRQRQVLSLPEILPKGDEDDQEAPSGTQQETPSSPVQITFPASAVKRFFEAVLHAYHLDHWQLLIDSAAFVTRVDPQIQAILLPQTPLPFDKPEQIPWLGTLATGLAGGVSLVRRGHADALISCLVALPRAVLLALRTFEAGQRSTGRGNAGACTLPGPDALSQSVPRRARSHAAWYLLAEGYQLCALPCSNQGGTFRARRGGAHAPDGGSGGLEQLPDLAALGIVTPTVHPRWFARDPDLSKRSAALSRLSEAQVRKHE